jgi:hypothetical protein
MKVLQFGVLFLLLFIGKSFADEPDVCIYEHSEFKGWKYCTNAQGLQDLSSRYNDQLSSLVVPDGYKLSFYDNADGTGGACEFYGQVGYVGDDCNDIASAISLEFDQAGADKKAEEEQAAAAAQADAALKAGRVCYSEDDGSFSSIVTEGLGEGVKDYPCLESGKAYKYVGGDLNDDIETVLVQGKHTEVTLYEHDNFQGRSVTLTCGRYELIDDPENEVSSISSRVLDEPQRCNMAIKQEVTNWGD